MNFLAELSLPSFRNRYEPSHPDRHTADREEKSPRQNFFRRGQTQKRRPSRSHRSKKI